MPDEAPQARPSALIVMGVSGSGKTTIGQELATRLGWTYEDADDYHPPANVAKMRAGEALTDDDRWPWLAAIADAIADKTAQGDHLVVGCSALKRAYRDALTRGRSDIRFVYLKGSREVIGERLAARKGHFMPASLLDSQFATLEEPAPEEHAIAVDIALPPAEVVDDIMRQLTTTSRDPS